MHTPERETRTPSTGSTGTRARRLAATASLAAAAIVGTAAGTLPARAANAAAPAIVPTTTFAANNTLFTFGAAVTFTVTEKTPTGTPVSSHATFEMASASGWRHLNTKALSSTGRAQFTFKPGRNHVYRVSFTSGTASGRGVKSAATRAVTVRMDIRSRVVATAAKQKGKPYRFGAAGPHAFDCSGLVKYVYGKYGIKLPHNSSALLKHGKRVSKADAKPGDIVLVMSGSHATHAAIYAGNGYWWEAPHTGATVRHVKIWSKNIQFRKVV